MKDTPYTSEFQKVVHLDATVNRMVKIGADPREIICALVREKEDLVARLIELERLAPKRYQLADGTVRIWNCPEALVPLTTLAGDQ
jgi:hypothetical protein